MYSTLCSMVVDGSVDILSRMHQYLGIKSADICLQWKTVTSSKDLLQYNISVFRMCSAVKTMVYDASLLDRKVRMCLTSLMGDHLLIWKEAISWNISDNLISVPSISCVPNILKRGLNPSKPPWLLIMVGDPSVAVLICHPTLLDVFSFLAGTSLTPKRSTVPRGLLSTFFGTPTIPGRAPRGLNDPCFHSFELHQSMSSLESLSKSPSSSTFTQHCLLSCLIQSLRRLKIITNSYIVIDGYCIPAEQFPADEVSCLRYTSYQYCRKSTLSEEDILIVLTCSKGDSYNELTYNTGIPTNSVDLLMSFVVTPDEGSTCSLSSSRFSKQDLKDIETQFKRSIAQLFVALQTPLQEDYDHQINLKQIDIEQLFQVFSPKKSPKVLV